MYALLVFIVNESVVVLKYLYALRAHIELATEKMIDLSYGILDSVW